MRLIHWSPAPADVSPVQRSNFIKVQIDGIAIGLANAASPFLPVFLTRLNASNFQVGLLTSMPALTGLLLAIPIGRFLQTRPQIVPWYSRARLAVVSAFAATGLAALLVPEKQLVTTVLLIWALVTIPQTIVAVAFSVVMNAVAGPTRRYELMSRRWSVLGLTTAITVAVVGQVLVWLDFPFNYSAVFIGLSLAGLASYYFSSRIDLPEATVPPQVPSHSWREGLRNYSHLVKGQPDFIRFSIQRFVYLTGTMLAVPIFPLYYVREVKASDAAIGAISTAQTAVLLIGYFLWTQRSRMRGSRFVLLRTTLAVAIYPALVSITDQVWLIALLAGVAGIFQAGIDLVFFDELMKTVPAEYSATFVSLAQSLQYFSSVFAPLIGTLLANYIGLSGALLVSAAIRLLGFGMFAFWRGPDQPVKVEHETQSVEGVEIESVPN